MAEERLQKILRSAGITSRRKAEALISAGRVRVNGQIVTELGTKADPRRAKVELDGHRLAAEPLCYGVMHKPRGMVSTMSDPEGRPTASDILKQVGVRVVPVGRLDFNTSGALLFTNDGDFAHALTHASGKAPKVYAAKVQQIVDDSSLEKWAEAIEIEGKMTRPAQIRLLRREGEKTWLEVTLLEGKNRQVRRLGEHARTPVVRLSRLSHAEITAEGLRPGQWRLLSVDELKTLKKHYGVPKKVHAQAAALAAFQAQKSPGSKLARKFEAVEGTQQRGDNKPSAAKPRKGTSASASRTKGGGGRKRNTDRDGSAQAASQPVRRGTRTTRGGAHTTGGRTATGKRPAPRGAGRTGGGGRPSGGSAQRSTRGNAGASSHKGRSRS